MHKDINVILKRTLIVVMLIHSLTLLVQNAVAAEPPPSPLNEMSERSDSSTEEIKTDLAAEKKQHLEKIKQQMQQLSLLWEEMQQRKIKESLPQPAVAPPLPEFVHQSTQIPVPPVPDPPSVEVIPDKGTEPLLATSPSPKAASSPRTEPEENGNIAGPIDRFALSSSLFATGHYTESLHVLGSLDKSQWTPNESQWAQFLEASCYRKLGQPEEAQRRYRRLVAESDSEWIGTLSRWWLDEIQDRKKIQQEIEALSTALKQWETEVDELARRND